MGGARPPRGPPKPKPRKNHRAIVGRNFRLTVADFVRGGNRADIDDGGP
jgi:hypothetical protein